MDQREDRIRERAAELWLAAGSPAERDLEFWLLAEHQIDTAGLRAPAAEIEAALSHESLASA